MSPITPATLAELSQDLLDSGRSIGSLVRETDQLRQLVNGISHLPGPADCDINAGKTITENGLAVSSAQAAYCAREPLRTAAFIKGLDCAIQTILQTKTQAKVLYAGCGPYALLALPVMARYTPAQLQFSMLEILPQTLLHARQLIQDLGLDAYVSDSHCIDASQYRIPASATPDIILSETMNIALAKEPQVAIMRNLYVQAPQALLVPQRVHVHLGHRKASPNFEAIPSHIDLGCIFTLDAEHIQSWQACDGVTLPAHSIVLATTDVHALYFLTRIHTFGEWQLRDFESSLNSPQKFVLAPEQIGRLQLDFCYRLGAYPGLFLQ